MATAAVIARPYAKAAFEYAVDSRTEKTWAVALAELAALFADSSMQGYLHHPRCSQSELVEILVSAQLAKLEQPIKNFLRLLAENSRLGVMAEISQAYEEYMAESLKVCHAVMISAMPVDSAYIEKIKQALSKKFNQTVEIETQIDEGLIGGAIIKAGDMVIDGSVKGQLHRLAQELRRN